MKEDTLATEMLKELKAQSKRWFIIAIVELVIILFSAILFVAYLNTPTEEKEEISYSQDADTGGENYVGRSHYDDKTIYVEKGNFKDMLLTLKHELMHVWLFENGHTNQNNDEVFGYEDVCELVALSNNSINRITKLYLDNIE